MLSVIRMTAAMRCTTRIDSMPPNKLITNSLNGAAENFCGRPVTASVVKEISRMRCSMRCKIAKRVTTFTGSCGGNAGSGTGCGFGFCGGGTDCGAGCGVCFCGCGTGSAAGCSFGFCGCGAGSGAGCDFGFCGCSGRVGLAMARLLSGRAGVSRLFGRRLRLIFSLLPLLAHDRAEVKHDKNSHGAQHSRNEDAVEYIHVIDQRVFVGGGNVVRQPGIR